MNICFVTTTPASAVGGVENVAFNIMEQAKKKGHKVENVYAYKNYTNPLSSLNAFKAVGKKVTAGNFDIVHSNDNASYYFAKHNNISKHVPIIHTSHGTWGNYFSAFSASFPFNIKKKIFSKNSIKIEKFVVQHADVNTSVSNYVQKSVLEQYRIKSEVIHNGVDTAKFSPAKTKNKIPTGIWVGTNPGLKGLNIAIESIKMLGLRLMVVGISGKDSKEVEYLGKIEPSQMPEIYRKADFLIFPSKYESHPIVPLEAMSSGLPVIVSSASNVEIIKNGKEGFVVSGKAEDYAKSIEKMLTRRRQMSASARKCAILHSWQIQSKKYFKLYEKLAFL
ncbi:MAG TPA: glycosyltransferase family 4 protein [archaeon]|nr:glycosyltransferase family 4 protein [archaeon]